jgi:methylase of polypeptide subunit release factors
LLAPLDNQRPDPVVLLCNLPYVPDTFHINQAATREPKLAIFGGSDGLDHYRALFKQLQQREWQPNHIITESLPAQHAALSVLAARYGYDVSMTDDFIQVFAAN